MDNRDFEHDETEALNWPEDGGEPEEGSETEDDSLDEEEQE